MSLSAANLAPYRQNETESEYASGMFLPELAGANFRRPDQDGTAAVARKLIFSQQYTVPTALGRNVTLGLLANYTSPRRQLLLGVFDDLANGGAGFFLPLAWLSPDRDLLSRYQRARTLSGAVAMKSSTVSATNAAINGAINAVMGQDPPDFLRSNFANIIVQKSDSRSYAAGVAAFDGIRALFQPFGDCEYRTPFSPYSSPIIAPSVSTALTSIDCEQYTVWQDRLTGGWVPTATAIPGGVNVSVFSSVTSTAARPLNLYGRMDGVVKFNLITNNGFASAVTCKVVAEIHSADATTLRDTTSFVVLANAVLSVGPNGNILSVVIPIPMWDIAGFVRAIFVDVLPDNDMLFISTAAPPLFRINLYDTDNGGMGPYFLAMMAGVAPGQQISISGCMNVEAVPDASLAQDVPTSLSFVEDPVVISLVNFILQRSTEIRPLMALSEFSATMQNHRQMARWDRMVGFAADHAPFLRWLKGAARDALNLAPAITDVVFPQMSPLARGAQRSLVPLLAKDYVAAKDYYGGPGGITRFAADFARGEKLPDPQPIAVALENPAARPAPAVREDNGMRVEHPSGEVVPHPVFGFLPLLDLRLVTADEHTAVVQFTAASFVARFHLKATSLVREGPITLRDLESIRAASSHWHLDSDCIPSDWVHVTKAMDRQDGAGEGFGENADEAFEGDDDGSDDGGDAEEEEEAEMDAPEAEGLDADSYFSDATAVSAALQPMQRAAAAGSAWVNSSTAILEGHRKEYGAITSYALGTMPAAACAAIVAESYGQTGCVAMRGNFVVIDPPTAERQIRGAIVPLVITDKPVVLPSKFAIGYRSFSSKRYLFIDSRLRSTSTYLEDAIRSSLWFDILSFVGISGAPAYVSVIDMNPGEYVEGHSWEAAFLAAISGANASLVCTGSAAESPGGVYEKIRLVSAQNRSPLVVLNPAAQTIAGLESSMSASARFNVRVNNMRIGGGMKSLAWLMSTPTLDEVGPTRALTEIGNALFLASVTVPVVTGTIKRAIKGPRPPLPAGKTRQQVHVENLSASSSAPMGAKEFARALKEESLPPSSDAFIAKYGSLFSKNPGLSPKTVSEYYKSTKVAKIAGLAKHMISLQAASKVAKKKPTGQGPAIGRRVVLDGSVLPSSSSSGPKKAKLDYF